MVDVISNDKDIHVLPMSEMKPETWKPLVPVPKKKKHLIWPQLLQTGYSDIKCHEGVGETSGATGQTCTGPTPVSLMSGSLLPGW